MADFTMTISGSAVPTEKTFEVVNPATGAVYAEAPDCTKEQLDAAFESASKAYRDWRLDENLRRQTLHKIGDALFGAAGDIGPVLTAEQGKPIRDSMIEADRFAAGVEQYDMGGGASAGGAVEGGAQGQPQAPQGAGARP